MSWLIATAILAPLASAAGSLALRKSPHWRDVITTLGLFAAAAAEGASLSPLCADTACAIISASGVSAPSLSCSRG